MSALFQVGQRDIIKLKVVISMPVAGIIRTDNSKLYIENLTGSISNIIEMFIKATAIIKIQSPDTTVIAVL